MKALTLFAPGSNTKAIVGPIEARLNAELDRVMGSEWMKAWYKGIPEWDAIPGEVNIFEILRLRNFVKAFDMIEYGKMRYNLLGNADHWFPRKNRANSMDGLDFTACLKGSPFKGVIKECLAEAHELMSGGGGGGARARARGGGPRGGGGGGGERGGGGGGVSKS